MSAKTTKLNMDAPAPAPVRMPSFATSTCISLLWQKASRHMQPHELEWLASGAIQEAGTQARELSMVLSNTACLVIIDDGDVGSFQCPRTASGLMLNLSHQLDTIAALADIGADASYRVQMALKGGAQ